MKPTTQLILKWLNSRNIQAQLTKFKQVNPSYAHAEVTVEEALNLFEINKDALIKAIEKNILDEQVSYSKRNGIVASLKTLSNLLTQISQPPLLFNAVNPSSTPIAQAIINGIVNFADLVDGAKIQERLAGFGDYKLEIDELSKTKELYNSIIKEIHRSQEISKEIQTTYDNLKSVSEVIKVKNNELEHIQKLFKEANEVYNKVNQNNQEIEDKKLKINAFHKNIEEYKESVSKLEVDAKNAIDEVINKEEIINKLINQAELALNLNSAEGISAAFSRQYLTAKEAAISKVFGTNINLWISGSALFVLCAIGITIWIATGQLSSDANGLSLIVARVIAVAISITGATFCAKQYIKQKNLAEDYAYKAVLSKSIIAFTDEIKKRDEQKVADYLTQVLSEIHQDPLRKRDCSEDKNLGVNMPELVEKLTEIILKTGKQ